MVTSLSERLKERMKALDMSAADLCRRVGIKPASASLWLDGTTKSIKGANLLKAAAALQVTPDWLSSGLGRKFPDEPTPRHEVNSEIALYGEPDILEAIALFRSLKPADRSEALSFLRIFASKKGVAKPKRERISLPATSREAA